MKVNRQCPLWSMVNKYVGLLVRIKTNGRCRVISNIERRKRKYEEMIMNDMDGYCNRIASSKSQRIILTIMIHRCTKI